MSGYSEDEKLRLQQLRALRRRWLRDQELSEREPVLPRRQLGPVAAFWERFLQPGGLWRHQKTPHGVVMSNPRIFPGDRILETGEIIPPLKEEPDEHH
ncbi:NADH dehydrogenase [ubiquinone] 1 beta subcomplex subunit 6 isoform X3 [Gymnogyps californianus]|uniref:NADH dehydrogenase [ubiquinone] 1 beta subcomplex subunit 6 isoform X3 n=1 Tax=Gymnogyps californianus TaxID=33616 RepID=UPI0021C6DA90|nr:NADH dehydrogenase [ubiquinone] 1 beta subcomplex subunit 6 isoform X3 [Gymnogyps californianus]